jgi:hypothetical protein
MAAVYESVTSSGTNVKTLTASNVNPGTANSMYGRTAESILLTIEGDAIRFRVDGTSPTASVGHALGTGNSMTLEKDLINFKAITTGTGTSTMHITYFYGPKQ